MDRKKTAKKIFWNGGGALTDSVSPSPAARIANLIFAGAVLAGSVIPATATADAADTSTLTVGKSMGKGSAEAYSGSVSIAAPVADEDGSYPSLSDYVGSLICTACGKHCLLTAPRCGIGTQWYQQAVSIYEATVSAEVTSSDASGTVGSGSDSSAEEALQAFLSGMICTGCGRHCPLTALECGVGQSYLKKAEAEFAAQQTASQSEATGADAVSDDDSGFTSASGISDDGSGSSGADSAAEAVSAAEAEGDALQQVMGMAPYGGLMIGGLYYAVGAWKKRRASGEAERGERDET